jgi:hypothetical protein
MGIEPKLIASRRAGLSSNIREQLICTCRAKAGPLGCGLYLGSRSPRREVGMRLLPKLCSRCPLAAFPERRLSGTWLDLRSRAGSEPVPNGPGESGRGAFVGSATALTRLERRPVVGACRVLQARVEQLSGRKPFGRGTSDPPAHPCLE